MIPINVRSGAALYHIACSLTRSSTTCSATMQHPPQSKTPVDPVSSLNEYLDRRDWRVNANANQGYSLGGMILNVGGKLIANYWLDHIYPAAVGQAHRDGDFHIHDLDM